MKYQIHTIDWASGHKRLRELRERVFVLEWQLSPTLEFDNHDEQAFHVVAKDESGQDIATARLTSNGEIGRIAVKPQHRSLALYKAIFKKLFNLAREHHIDHVFIRCNLDGVEKMTRYGYQRHGKVFMEGGIPMQRLVYPSNQTVQLPDIRQLH
ncbi:GNAT family N-acetyltransferase [Alteromonas sediminis]|uniref:GNAT family N-acetyltransferase n=1 Tax=Alteromonas sediminis TaxID=2259342 RepID=A0A3N5ZED5_9ALTE|nr:GNAT family N-acetyltransferase [Alteromonas sediminis]RPJ68728.1 GNAT family N-acetyltransferase [Alteromonas sediminis]